MAKKDVKLNILGMTCASCARTVERGLSKLEGVEAATVNIATEQAAITFDPTVLNTSQLIQRVREVGYDANVQRVMLPIGGMTCAACVRHVERALSKVDGVVSVKVNLATERAAVEYLPSIASLEDFKKAVADAGYELLEQEAQATGAEQEDLEMQKMETARKNMIIAWALTAPVMFIMLLDMIFRILPMEWMMAINIALMVLALPVLVWPGRATFRSAWSSVTHGSANMDALIAMGTGASWISGPLSLVMPLSSYAAIAAMIMAIHLTGRYVEASAKGRASQAIRKLLQLGAKTAHRAGRRSGVRGADRRRSRWAM